MATSGVMKTSVAVASPAAAVSGSSLAADDLQLDDLLGLARGEDQGAGLVDVVPPGSNA